MVERDDGERRLELTHATGACQKRTPQWTTNVAGLYGRKELALIGMVMLAAGCIGTNPRWDGPGDESIADDGDTTGARGATGGTDGASTESGIPELDDAAGAESNMNESSTTESSTTGSSTMDEAGGESSSGESTGAPAPACPGMEIVCDGECHDVASDKRACGLDCIDCTELFGNQAKCEVGQCVDPDGDEGGGDDGGDD